MFPKRFSIPRTLTFIFLLLLVFSRLFSEKIYSIAYAQDTPPSPAQVIEAVNALRIDAGLYPLSVHPVLMQVAQTQADGIANGLPGHWRPDGLTLGMWLISLGYPLAGDLTQDGYRSENWGTARSVEEIIQGWLGDAAHTNTMLSPERSDIGVGISVSDQTYIVLETALRTASGEMPPSAYPLLTQVASPGGVTEQGLLLSQIIKPVVLSTARPNGDVVHQIDFGQSLWSIAIAYQTTIDQIRAWNNLGEETIIYEGQYLLVQRNATQPPPPTATPRASATPVHTETARQTFPSVTPTLTPVETDAAAQGAAKDEANAVWVGIIVLFVVLAAPIGVWLLRRGNEE